MRDLEREELDKVEKKLLNLLIERKAKRRGLCY